MFANSPAETKTSSERAMAQSFVNQIGNIGAILTAIVGAVFFTMLIVTANTMAQSVRERTNEIGVLKTLGFSNAGVLGLVLSESVLVTSLGAGARHGGRVVDRRAVRAACFGSTCRASACLRTRSQAAAIYMVALGLVAGAVPAVQAMRLRIVEALRRD